MSEAPRRNPESRPPMAADEFYVGYLPMPPAHGFYVRLAIPFFLWLALGVATMVSRTQSNPGDGVWKTDQIVTLEGLVGTLPYPLLRIPSSRLNQPYESVLMVETGKFGGARAAAFANRLVRATGWLIERDGRRILELAAGDSSLQEIKNADSAIVSRLSGFAFDKQGRITLRGEIVDSKCFLGVMKPGHGKTHKECATLCISGGIPPLFVARDAAGTRQYYLLTNSAGTGLDRAFLPYVDDPIELSGEVEQHGDLLILKAGPSDIQRL